MEKKKECPKRAADFLQYSTVCIMLRGKCLDKRRGARRTRFGSGEKGKEKEKGERGEIVNGRKLH